MHLGSVHRRITIAIVDPEVLLGSGADHTFQLAVDARGDLLERAPALARLAASQNGSKARWHYERY